MLYRLEVENFYSIRDLQVVDLIASNYTKSDAEGHLAPIAEGMDELVPKVIAIFGANASGKSNVLKAISFLAWFTRNSFSNPLTEELPFQRFLNVDGMSAPTRLCMHFTAPADLTVSDNAPSKFAKFSYELVLGRDSKGTTVVYSETLSLWRRKRTVLFHRDETGQVQGNRAFQISGYQAALRNILRPNAGVISTLAQLHHPMATFLWNGAADLISNILLTMLDIDEAFIAKFYQENPETLKGLNKVIEKIDLGISEIVILDAPGGPYLAARHKGLSSELFLAFESHGTKQFVKIFPVIFQVLETGGVAVIDELDQSIHPLLVPEILSWFYDKERNPNNAQLWFTSQAAYLLEQLIKEEIFFCEKDDHGRTEIYGLRDIQSVRRQDNYYKHYLGGSYGAVPRLG